MKHFLILRTVPDTFPEVIKKFDALDPEFRYMLLDYSMLRFFIPESGELEGYINGKSLDEFSGIFFNQWRNKPYYISMAGAIALYASMKNIPFIDTEVGFTTIGNKLNQALVFRKHQLPHPSSYFFTEESFKKDFSYAASALHFPMVVKSADGKKGRDNVLVHSLEELERALDTFEKKEVIVCQEYIPNDSDYRFFVCGNEVSVIKKRIRVSDETHLNNTSQGADVEYIDPSTLPELCALALDAAKAYKREIAGVDIMVSSLDQKAYILEINPAPQYTHDPILLEAVHNYFKGLSIK